MSDDAEPSIDGRGLTQRELLLVINGKLDVFAAELKTTNDKVSDHENRLRVLQNARFVTWRQFWAGVATAAAAAGGFATAFAHIHLS